MNTALAMQSGLLASTCLRVSWEEQGGQEWEQEPLPKGKPEERGASHPQHKLAALTTLQPSCRLYRDSDFSSGLMIQRLSLPIIPLILLSPVHPSSVIRMTLRAVAGHHLEK